MADKIPHHAIEAYEALLEQAELEAYFRHHLAPSSACKAGSAEDNADEDTDVDRLSEAERGSEDDKDGGSDTDDDDDELSDQDWDQEDEEEEGGRKETRTRASQQASSEESEDLGEDDEDGSSDGKHAGSHSYSRQSEPLETQHGWSDTELDLFFTSLARHSRLRPDLIAADLSDHKTPSQVAHLIHRFEQEKGAAESRETLSKRKRRPQKRTCPAAFEMSSSWIAYEERIATHLRVWQDAQDAEAFDLGLDPARSNTDWDSQVCTILLFLRHTPVLNPDMHEPNVCLLLPSKVKLDVFAFSAEQAIEVLVGKRKAITNRSSLNIFAIDHPVPRLAMRHGDSVYDLLAWRVLYRSIELGLLACIEIKAGARTQTAELVSAQGMESTERMSVFHRNPGQMLVWREVLPSNTTQDQSNNDIQAATRIGATRSEATQRLVNTMKLRELKGVSGLFFSRMQGKENESNPSRAQFDEPAAGNCDPADSTGGVQQPAGDQQDYEQGSISVKRKAVNEQHGTERKKRSIGKSGSEDDSEDEISQAGETDGKQELPRYRDRALQRFLTIGVSREHLVDELAKSSSADDVNLFNLSRLADASKACLGATGLDQEHADIEGLSWRTVETLALLVRKFVQRLINMVENDMSHSLRPLEDRGDKSSISSDHVRSAMLRLLDRYGVLHRHNQDHLVSQSQADSEALAIRFMRSEPAYHLMHGLLDPNDVAHQSYVTGLVQHLDGIKSLSKGSWTLGHAAAYSGVRHDGVLSATDAFVVPLLDDMLATDTYGHPSLDIDGGTESESGSDEPVLYEGEEDERLTLSRNDVRLGVIDERDSGQRSAQANARRQRTEESQQARLDADDTVQAQRYERFLWRLVGYEAQDGRSREENAVEGQDKSKRSEAGDKGEVGSLSESDSTDTSSDEGDEAGAVHSEQEDESE